MCTSLNCEMDDGEIKKYNGTASEVIIPEGVKMIGSGAFSYCNTLESVILPSTLEATGVSVFACCESLKKVTMQSSFSINVPFVKTPPNFGLFCGCKGLKSAGPIGSGTDIEFSWTESIPPMAFYGSELENVTIPDTILCLKALSFFRNSRTHMNITLSPFCSVEAKVFAKNVTIHFSKKINSKEKIGTGIVDYANAELINNLTNDELAWIVLYQSKKWTEVVLHNIDAKRIPPVLQSCYTILESSKKVSSAQGKTLVELLKKLRNYNLYNEESVKLKEFLERKRCEVAELISGPEKSLVNEMNNASDNQVILSSKINIDDEVCFGTFPQSESLDPEPIQWKVISVEDDWALMISKYNLDIRPYNEERKKVSWKNSDIRKWLNETFLKTAFKINEQKIIQKVNGDFVSLLTKDEVKEYFSGWQTAITTATEYACMSEPGKKADDPSAWWLKLPVGSDTKAPFVHGINSETVMLEGDGFAQLLGNGLSVANKRAVRPVLWISISMLQHSRQ